MWNMPRRVSRLSLTAVDLTLHLGVGSSTSLTSLSLVNSYLYSNADGGSKGLVACHMLESLSCDNSCLVAWEAVNMFELRAGHQPHLPRCLISLGCLTALHLNHCSRHPDNLDLGLLRECTTLCSLSACSTYSALVATSVLTALQSLTYLKLSTPLSAANLLEVDWSVMKSLSTLKVKGYSLRCDASLSMLISLQSLKVIEFRLRQFCGQSLHNFVNFVRDLTKTRPDVLLDVRN